MLRNLLTIPGLCGLFLSTGITCLLTLEVWGNETQSVRVLAEPYVLLSVGWSLIFMGCVVGLVFLLRNR